MQDNQDNIYQFDGSEDQTQLTPDMEALDRRLMQDAKQWDAESPDIGALATYALALATEPPAAALTDSKVSRNPAPAPRITPRLQPLVPRQPSAWAAYIVTLGIVVAMALMLLWPSLLPHTPTVDSPTPTANAPVATGTSLPTGTSTTSPTATTSGGAGTGFTVIRVTPAVDLSQTPDASGNANLTTFSSSSCGQTAKIALNITFDTSNRVKQGKITYRWRRSDGFVSDPIWFYFGDISGPPLGYAPAQASEWDLPAIQADGSAKWLDVEVLEPNLITARLNLQATCQFSIQGGTTSASPTAYNCTAGGDQTFIFTGTLLSSYAPGSHTVTYHWQRSDGSVTADQTVTFGEGRASMSVQPDQWIVHQVDVGPGRSDWDQLVATSPSPRTVASQAIMNISCP